MLASLYSAGYRLVVITNQQGVGKGLVKRKALENMHERMCSVIEQNGAKIDGVHFCPHLATDACACRKPKPGLIFAAVEALEYKIDLQQSWFVGDSPTDIQAGQAAGLRTVLVGSSQALPTDLAPTHIVHHVNEVARIIAGRP